MGIPQMHDSKGHVSGCWGRASAEKLVSQGRKAGASSRTPHGILYGVNYTARQGEVKENFGGEGAVSVVVTAFMVQVDCF
jgi:hypothetical protein